MKSIKDENYLTNDSTVGVANYLVSLYVRTGNKYRYYPTKLNKLLTIYKLCSLKYNDKCLADNQFVITDSGNMGILSGIYSPFYYDYTPIEENCSEITDKLENFDPKKNHLSSITKHIHAFFGEKYEEELCISEDSKKLLELIFRKFGNYSKEKLNIIINEITSKIPLNKKYNENNYITYYNFIKFLNENKSNLKNNILFKFINNFDRLNIDKTYNINTEIFNAEQNQSNIEKKYNDIISKFKKLNSTQKNELIVYLTELSNNSKSKIKKKKLNS